MLLPESLQDRRIQIQIQMQYQTAEQKERKSPKFNFTFILFTFCLACLTCLGTSKTPMNAAGASVFKLKCYLKRQYSKVNKVTISCTSLHLADLALIHHNLVKTKVNVKAGVQPNDLLMSRGFMEQIIIQNAVLTLSNTDGCRTPKQGQQ